MEDLGYIQSNTTAAGAAAAAAAAAGNNNLYINTADGVDDFPISRVHSRASVSGSIIGLGPKQTTTFGGAPPPWAAGGGYDRARTHSECVSNVGSVVGVPVGAPLGAPPTPQAAGGGPHTAVFPKPRSEIGEQQQQQQQQQQQPQQQQQQQQP